jgi:topoisomerase IV subunit B
LAGQSWETDPVTKPAPNEPTTTHDWAKDHDAGHIEQVRRQPAVFAPDGALHLVLEVLAYAADEAAHTGSGNAVITLHDDGSVSVTDDGRGTATRGDDQEGTVKKPVMTTKDLRFFDTPNTAALPDGHPRRGMSVVTALSTWLEHTNRRHDGAWTQHYQDGVPVTRLAPIPDNGTTGTTVRFLPDPALITRTEVPVPELRQLARALGPPLTVKIIT